MNICFIICFWPKTIYAPKYFNYVTDNVTLMSHVLCKWLLHRNQHSLSKTMCIKYTNDKLFNMTTLVCGILFWHLLLCCALRCELFVDNLEIECFYRLLVLIEHVLDYQIIIILEKCFICNKILLSSDIFWNTIEVFINTLLPHSLLNYVIYYSPLTKQAF